MELDFAVLTEAATTSADGRLNLLGCGFDIYLAPRVPFDVPRIVLAMRFLVRPAEVDRPHGVEVRLVDGDGNDVMRPLTHTVRTQMGRLEGAIIPLPLILEMGPLRFERHGPYSFDIRYDGRTALGAADRVPGLERNLKRVPLYVVAQL